MTISTWKSTLVSVPHSFDTPLATVYALVFLSTAPFPTLSKVHRQEFVHLVLTSFSCDETSVTNQKTDQTRSLSFSLFLSLSLSFSLFLSLSLSFSLFPFLSILLFFHNFPIIFLHLLPFSFFLPFLPKKTFSHPLSAVFWSKRRVSLQLLPCQLCAVRGTSHTEDTETNAACCEREFSLFLRIFWYNQTEGPKWAKSYKKEGFTNSPN